MLNSHETSMPPLFMSANWYSEKSMTKLFIAGLQQGVRGFDTAREYKAEKKVGKAIRKALNETGIKRTEIFVQTRICNEELLSGAKVQDEVERSLEKMGFDYLDCFMFHWPTPGVYINAWKQLVDTYLSTSLIRGIGLCNCRLRHLKEMVNAGIKVLPQILQIEVTPFWQNVELKNWCDCNGIEIQAFSPLCKMIEPIRKNKLLVSLSEKYGVSVAQIILRWHLQRGIVPISSTSKVERVQSNFDILGFSLSENDMKQISSLDCGWKYHLESSTCFGY